MSRRGASSRRTDPIVQAEEPMVRAALGQEKGAGRVHVLGGESVSSQPAIQLGVAGIEARPAFTA
jgi:hypothetical protein